MTQRTRGYIHVEAHGAFEAVCTVHACLMDWGDFAITDMMPTLAQVWRRGRYDWTALEYFGEWRVPVWVRTDDAGTIPDDVWRFLRNVPCFLDLRVYPERATDDSGERRDGGADQLPQYREVVSAGPAGIEQGSRENLAVLAGDRA